VKGNACYYQIRSAKADNIFLVAMIGSSQSLDFSNIEQPFTDVDFGEIVNK
jgi:hypothetical protein